MNIRAILFDADGVLQQRPPGWRSSLGKRLGFSGNPDAFIAEIYTTEPPILDGRTDFIELLLALLKRWNCRASLEEALTVWTMLDVDEELLNLIEDLRQRGVQCHLASNQEPYKARYMSEVLGYQRRFDNEFYSCHLGYKKPDQRYFLTILQELALPPEQILFIDDRQPNVDSAKTVGLKAETFDLKSGRGELHRILRVHGIPID